MYCPRENVLDCVFHHYIFSLSKEVQCSTYSGCLSNPVFPSHTVRHLDYFEMLRNEDELALSKRFESVSKKKTNKQTSLPLALFLC